MTRDRDRGWRHYWVQAYCVSPIMTPVLAAKVAPLIKKLFGNNAGYYDGATANRLWNYVDY